MHYEQLERDYHNRSFRKKVDFPPRPRWRRLPIIRGSIALLVGGIAFSFMMTDSEADLPPAAAKAPEQKEKRVPADSIFEGRIAAGATYYTLMADFNIDQNQAVEFYEKYRGLKNGSFHTGDSFVIVKSKESRLLSFSLRSPQRIWCRVVRSENGIEAGEELPLFRTEERRISGILENNLYESILKQGERPELVAQFVDVFGWDINFFTDPRSGDAFDIIAEKIYDRGEFVKYGGVLAARYVCAGRTFEAFLFGNGKGALAHYDSQGRAVQKMFLKAPLHYTRISSRFSYRRFHPVLHMYRAHPAVDYAAPPGTPIFAAADGSVEYAKWSGGYGRCICIRHGNAYKTYYGHLSQYARDIEAGARVRQRQVVGYVGASGLANGPHLDFRVERNGSYINPLAIKSPDNKCIARDLMAGFESLRDARLAQLNGETAGPKVAMNR